MKIINTVLASIWCAILAILLLAIGIAPNILFQYMGWSSNSDLDYLSRTIGCIIVLFIIVWYGGRNRE